MSPAESRCVRGFRLSRSAANRDCGQRMRRSSIRSETSPRLLPISEERIAALSDAPTHSYENAVPIDSGPVPTVIFSHGGFAYRQSNSALMEHLASHGYLVLSITHPYVSSGTIHENGDIVPFAQEVADGMMSSAADPDYLAAFAAEDPGVRLEAFLRNTKTFVLAAAFHRLGGRLHACHRPVGER